MIRTARGLAVALSLLTTVAACGLPSDESARSIDPADVPYGLLDEARGSGDTTVSGDPDASEPALFWVDDDGRLIASSVSAPIDEGSLYARVQQLLDELAAGPADPDRTGGLSTNLTPESRITVVEASGSTVVLDVEPGPQEPSADRLPLAIGQITLTATSVPGIEQALFTREGGLLEVPLPGGALTSEPVTADDYAGLVKKRKER